MTTGVCREVSTPKLRSLGVSHAAKFILGGGGGGGGVEEEHTTNLWTSHW